MIIISNFAHYSFRYEYSHTTNRLWRKNRAGSNSALGKLMPPCTGVDLNRNFGYRWGAFSLDPRVGSRLTCLETYMGTRPFSEPETTAIRRFIMGQPSGTFEVLIIFESPLDILYTEWISYQSNSTFLIYKMNMIILDVPRIP